MAYEKKFFIQEFVKHREDGMPVYRDVEISDGRWVIEVAPGDQGGEQPGESFNLTRWSYEIVGPKPTAEHVLRLGYGDYHFEGGMSWHRRIASMLVCDQPFGVIKTVSSTDTGAVSGSSTAFESARQIHKGELGQFPPFPTPRFVREGRKLNVPEGEIITRTCRRALRRNSTRWARLVEVAAIVGMPHQQLVERFYPFGNTEGHGLPVLFAATPEEIHGKVIPNDSVKRFGEAQFPQLFDRNPATIWVRRGFARTMLCLHHLGYDPNATPKVA